MVVVEGLLSYTQKRRKKKRNESDEIWSKPQRWSRHHSNRHAESRRKGGRSLKILKKLLNWRNTRKPVWADKEAREPRDQRLRASRWITIWGNQVGVKMLQATKSVPWEVRGKLRRAERRWKPSLFLLDSPGSASLLFQLQGYFHVYTQGTICYFAAWLIMKSPMC